jgi:hypothetical protein
MCTLYKNTHFIPYTELYRVPTHAGRGVSETGSDLSADVGVEVTYGLQAALSWGLNQRARGGHGAVDGAPAGENSRKLIINIFS